MEDFMQTVLKSISEALIPCVFIVLLVMPFWYIAFYLLHRNFFEKSSQFLKLCFSFCLSFCWYVTIAFFTMCLPSKELEAPVPSEDSILPLIGSTTQNFYFLSTVFSIFFLCLLIILNYHLIRVNKGKDFYTILKTSYIGLLLGLIGVLALMHLYYFIFK
jgi:hypothetical protein